MGRTWRKNTDYGSKRNHRDEQRELQKKAKKLQKYSKDTKDDIPEDLWLGHKRVKE